MAVKGQEGRRLERGSGEGEPVSTWQSTMESSKGVEEGLSDQGK